MKTLSFWCILLTFLVILAGGIVRTTGSGMGCPDWPKCFDHYIPPTDVKELPLDYKTRFAVQGKEIAEFSAFKTWTEYINRLCGALLGGFVLLLFAQSIRTKTKLYILLSGLVVVLTGFQAWLGKLVVDSDLNVVKITTHLLVAFVILLALIYIYWASSEEKPIVFFNPSTKKTALTFLVIAMVLTLLQVLLGTQVREQIDTIAKEYNFQYREYWVGKVDVFQKIHGTFAWLVLLINIYLVKEFTANKLQTESYALILILSLELLGGLVMSYLGIPAWIQPIHMLLANALIGLQFYLFLKVKAAK